jgi:1,4-dihydroxy-2-naphthoyl-CoA hydrolase
MPYTHLRTVQFRDTDAAGVVYFANVLAMCHEAYEASLAADGFNLTDFFSGKPVAVPIVHASVDFMQPMRCGDRLQILLTVAIQSDYRFQIDYSIAPEGLSEPVLSRAKTIHVCIDPTHRAKTAIPAALRNWAMQQSPLD